MPDEHPGLPVDPDEPEGRNLRPSGVALVFLGGAIGTAARYGLALAAPTESRGWPTGTFVANVLGALVLGALLEGLARAGPDDGWRLRARLLAGTGFCGGFTTYSTFAVEADLLVRAHATGLAVGYLVASVGVGLVATILGVMAAARWRSGA